MLIDWTVPKIYAPGLIGAQTTGAAPLVPSYPTEIPTRPQGYILGDNPYGDFAFTFGGKDYFIGFASGSRTGLVGDFKLHCFKSSDLGLTWTEPGSGPLMGPTQVWAFAPALDIGAAKVVIIVPTGHSIAGPVGTAIDGLDVHVYNLTTDTWSGPTHYTAPLLSFTIGNWNPNTRQVSMRLITCGTNDYEFIYVGGVQSVSGSNWCRLFVVSFNGTTFGTPVQIPGQTGVANGFFSNGGIFDGTNVHFLITDGSSAYPTPSNVYHISRDHGTGTFGTFQIAVNSLVASNVDFPATSDLSLFDLSGTLTLGFATWVWDSPFVNPRILWVYAPNAINPVWSNSNASGVLPANQPDPAVCCAIARLVSASVKNGKVIVAWNKGDGGEFFGAVWSTKADVSALTWDVPSKLMEAPNDPGDDNLHNCVQVYTYPSTTGVGVFGIYEHPQGAPEIGSQLAQYSLIPVSSPPPPGPTCSLSASSGSIPVGGSVTLSWTTTNTPTNATIDNGIGSVPPISGHVSVRPSETTTYHLTVTNADGTSNCQVTVSIVDNCTCPTDVPFERLEFE